MATNVVVGRQQVVRDLLEAVDQGAVCDVVGIPGSGRTTLLRALSQELAGRPRTVVVSIDGSLYGAGESGSGLAATPHGALELLEDLREQVNERIDHAEPVPTSRSHAADQHPPSVAGVVERLWACSTDRRVVILVDNASTLAVPARTDLYRVLQRLAGRPSVAAVLARTAGSTAPPQGLGVEKIVVSPLNRTDVAAYLDAALVVGADHKLAAAIHEWSGGYPPALVAAVDELRAAAHTDFPQLARRGIAVPSATAVLRGIPAASRPMVDVAGVLRTATITDLLDIMDRLGTAPTDDVASALGEIPLLEHNDEGRYRLPAFLREHIVRDLRNRRPGDADTDAFDEINNQAIRRLREKLRDQLSDARSVYASWERLEHSETQHLLLEFAYHGGLRKGSKHARFPLASVFFDVVWWWAWYVDSPFLTQLLAAWRASARGDEDGDFVTELEQFRLSYMKMTNATSEHAQADAAAAAAALQEIMRILDLDRSGASNRHVLAIINALLGDALRIQDVRDLRVDVCYQHALDDFRENGAQAAMPTRPGDTRTVEDDAWCVPWMLHRQADLALERGSVGIAQARAHEALTLALATTDKNDLDYEVVAQCHRVLGDALLERDPSGAFREYARCVFAAYAFHSTPLPDEYTRRFHREQVDVVMKRLRGVARTRPKVVPAIADEVAAWNLGSGSGNWTDLLARQCWDEVQILLFPREPWPEELDRDTAYSKRVRMVSDALSTTLLEPAPEAEMRRGLRRFMRRRAQSGATPGEQPPRYGLLPDPAVESHHFTPADDQYWPRWWLDDSAPGAWPELDRAGRIPSEVVAALQAAIAELPPLRRQVLELRDVQQWSRTAVSRELGISEDDQLLMLHRARSAVRRALDRRLSGARTS